MTVADDHPLDERPRDPLLLELVGHKRRWVHHYAPAVDPDDVAGCVAMGIEAVGAAQDCYPEGWRDEIALVQVLNIFSLVFFLDVL